LIHDHLERVDCCSMKIEPIFNFEGWPRITSWRSTNLRKAEIFISIRSKVIRQILAGYIHGISPWKSGDHVWIHWNFQSLYSFCADHVGNKIFLARTYFYKSTGQILFRVFCSFFAKSKKHFFRKIDNNSSLVTRILKAIRYQIPREKLHQNP
jgi:hypothetical protein